MIGLFFSCVWCVLLIGFSALFQSVFIPEDLYRRMYFCLKSLVTLPEPYCAIALNYARQMKMEQNAPGNICSYIKAIKAMLVLIWCQTRIKLGCFPCIKLIVKLDFWSFIFSKMHSFNLILFTWVLLSKHHSCEETACLDTVYLNQIYDIQKMYHRYNSNILFSTLAYS